MITNFIVNGIKEVAISILGASYYICLGVATVSVFAYILGVKKAAKVATGSTMLYFILEAFKVMML